VGPGRDVTPRLQGRVALVTGAARGLGAAIAEAFVAEGAQVLLTDIDEAAGRAAAQRLDTGWMRLDVREEMAWIAALARLLDSHGRLDLLVNNAAIAGLAPSLLHDPEHASLADWQAQHRTALDGVFLGCKHGLRAMRRGGGAGCIITVTTRTGCASGRAAVRAHARAVALYAAAQGLALRCSSLHAGAGALPADVAARAVQLAAGAAFSRRTARPGRGGAGRA
jgi:3(or 17)beta-hydroxysteroid dehydrogenase